MEYRFVQLKIADGIAMVIVNRPEKRNALCPQMIMELLEIFKHLDTNKDAKVVIFTGTGKTFIAGLDLEEMVSMKPPAYMEFGASMMQVAKTIREISKPVIGVINGHAFGGGNAIVMACDLVIASEKAQFGQQEINVGIFGGAYILPKLVGRCRAAEIVMLGESFSAQEAFKMGLVNRVVPPDQLEKEAKEIAQKLLSKSPLALKVAKKAMLAGFNYDLEMATSYQIALMAILYGSHDQREGMEAFLAKRKPSFIGE